MGFQVVGKKFEMETEPGIQEYIFIKRLILHHDIPGRRIIDPELPGYVHIPLAELTVKQRIHQVYINFPSGCPVIDPEHAVFHKFPGNKIFIEENLQVFPGINALHFLQQYHVNGIDRFNGSIAVFPYQFRFLQALDNFHLLHGQDNRMGGIVNDPDKISLLDLIGTVYPISLDDHQPGKGDGEHNNCKDDHPLFHKGKITEL
jgi:hypothetical protein